MDSSSHWNVRTLVHVAGKTVFILPKFKTLSDFIAVDCERAVVSFVVAAGVDKFVPETAIEGNS
jgi:hypothetical protein